MYIFIIYYLYFTITITNNKYSFTFTNTSPSPRHHLAMTYILYTHSNASSKLQSILFKSNIRPKSSYNVILSF